MVASSEPRFRIQASAGGREARSTLADPVHHLPQPVNNRNIEEPAQAHASGTSTQQQTQTPDMELTARPAPTASGTAREPVELSSEDDMRAGDDVGDDDNDDTDEEDINTARGSILVKLPMF